MMPEALPPFQDLLWLAGAKAPPAVAGDPARIDWQRLIGLAYEQRMLFLLHDRIVGHLQALPGYEDHVRLLRKAQTDVVRRNLALSAETLRLVGALEARSIQALAFKGCILSAVVYHSLSARKDGDIDLLVRKEEVFRALEVLAECGYQPYRQRSAAEAAGHLEYDCEWELFHSGKCIGLDLHWEFSSRNSGMPVPQFLDRVWSSPYRTIFCGRPILTFAADDLIFVLCIHAAKNQWQRLEWIHTLARLVDQSPSIDWKTLFGVAAACASERTLALGLAICTKLYAIKLPDEAARRIRADGQVDGLADRALRWLLQGKSNSLSSSTLRKFNVDARKSLSDKIRYLVYAAATPSAKDYFVDLPAWLSWLYYFIRTGRLLAAGIANLFIRVPTSPPREIVHWIPKPEILSLNSSPNREVAEG